MPAVTKAVIPAAGLGTRQYPATSYLKKEFFPLVDRDGFSKPVIQIVVEEALAGGVEEVCIVCQPGVEAACRSHFSPLSAELARRFEGKQWAFEQSEKLRRVGERLSFVEQKEQGGLGHAVWCARQWVGSEPFLVLLGDHVFISTGEEPCSAQLLDAFSGQSVTALVPVGEDQFHRYGLARGHMAEGSQRLLRAQGFIEKPEPEVARTQCRIEGFSKGGYLAHFGMHVFTSGLFEVLDEMIRSGRRDRGEYQLTTAQNLLCGREPYMGFVVEGLHYDMGTPAGLLEAQMALALAGQLGEKAQQMWQKTFRDLGPRTENG